MIEQKLVFSEFGSLPKAFSIYKWYKNPIKWYRDKKKITMMNEIIKHQYEHYTYVSKSFNGRGSNIPQGYGDDGFIK